MNRIFLGPLLHWLVVLIVVALGWLAGRARLHVTDFNLFVILAILGSVAVLGIVIVTARPGTRITREPLEEDDPADADPATTFAGYNDG